MRNCVDIFKGEKDEEMTFQSFYTNDGKPCEAQIIRFIKNVIYSDALPEQLKAVKPTDDEDMNVYDEGEAVDSRTTSNRDKYKVKEGNFGLSNIAASVVYLMNIDKPAGWDESIIE